ncbi:MAG: NnrU family protein [Alphaproteobacteria bacterium]|nr:NnrU family protein [Alphaproteobacteria bacterium]
MTMLIAAALFFLLLHLVVAGTQARDVIVGAIGERPYLGLFSLASLGGIVWLVMAYNAATKEGPALAWDLGPGVTHVGIIVVGLAFLLGVPGLLVPNPTAVMQGDAAKREGVVHGILRITRHPFLWGVALWAAFHLAANGDQASAVFFGTFLVLAVAGTFSIDGKRKRKLGADWDAFAKSTSNIPFGAILTGRNSLKFGELVSYRMVVALILFLVVLFAHRWLFGVSPFPGGWSPY